MSQLTILLAEDDEGKRNNLAKNLRATGLRVIEAADGREALDLVRGGQQFHILITDYQMPWLNGAELVDELRRDGCTQPMIVWTAWWPLPQCPGADCVISKMNGLPAVIAAIRQCLRKRP